VLVPLWPCGASTLLREPDSAISSSEERLVNERSYVVRVCWRSSCRTPDSMRCCLSISRGMASRTTWFEVGKDPWRARIHTATGTVLGAGIVLDERHVLTCAHVVARHAAPDIDDWALAVDAVGTIPVARRRARIAVDGWIPLRSNVDHVDEGDLALLELDEPLSGVPEELLQIDALAGAGAEIEYGFSGAGVVDERGAVIGMVVSKLMADWGRMTGRSWARPAHSGRGQAGSG
jgi:hypothetical protein